MITVNMLKCLFPEKNVLIVNIAKYITDRELLIAPLPLISKGLIK